MSEPYATLSGDADDTPEESDAATDRLAAVRAALRATLGDTKAHLRRRLYSLRFGDWVTILLTLGVVSVVGTAFAGPTGAALTVASGLLLAATLATTASDNPLVTALGVAVGTLAGAATLAMGAFVVYVVLQRGFFGLFAGLGLLSLALASFGAFLTPARTLSRLAILRSSAVLVTGALGIGFVLAAQVLPRAALRGQAVDALAAVGDVVVSTLLSVAPSHALATFLILVSITLFAVGRLLARLPVERLLPPDRRSGVTATITTVQAWRSTAARGLFSLGAVVGFGLLLNAAAPAGAATITRYTSLLRTDVLAATLPPSLGGLLVGIVTAPSLRAALLVTTIGSVGVLAVFRALGSLRRGLGWTLARLLAPIAGGVLTALPAGYLAAEFGVMERLLAAAPSAVPAAIIEFAEAAPPFAAGTAVVGLLVLLALQPLGVVGSLKTVLVIPNRAGSVALSSVGLFGVAVAAVIVDLVGFAVVAAAAGLCVWDVGEFGTGIREELPDGSPTLRTETIHAAGSLLYCTVAAAGAWLLYQLAVPRLTPPAADIAAVGVVLSLGIAALLALRVSSP
ncbi:hypothetical protein EGH24_00015 [Halonotius terrestris]|uniref:Uncharacterized protein n=1 Tax=Halonotius terrestris TaxID=2487750 RepID=A0A8J8TCE6_9EURY|nr:hypothetical protein [Halonotius terrestris]TQQ83230.1 hypothetical protein EGH24_00015 [Halonotius terrestris]